MEIMDDADRYAPSLPPSLPPLLPPSNSCHRVERTEPSI
jgi:hypothetical protein